MKKSFKDIYYNFLPLPLKLYRYKMQKYICNSVLYFTGKHCGKGSRLSTDMSNRNFTKEYKIGK